MDLRNQGLGYSGGGMSLEYASFAFFPSFSLYSLLSISPYRPSPPSPSILVPFQTLKPNQLVFVALSSVVVRS